MATTYQFDKKRFETFIDAIIAIILTILVLEIKVPEGELEHVSVPEQIRLLIPYLVSYLASFMLIVGFWIDYHLLFINISLITKRFILLNMLFILSISLAPFVTAFAAKHYRDPFAVAFLSAAYFIMNFNFMLIYIYARKKNLTEPDFWKANRGTSVYSAIGITLILAAIPLAYVNTYISFVIFLVVFGWHLAKKNW